MASKRRKEALGSVMPENTSEPIFHSTDIFKPPPRLIFFSRSPTLFGISDKNIQEVACLLNNGVNGGKNVFHFSPRYLHKEPQTRGNAVSPSPHRQGRWESGQAAWSGFFPLLPLVTT